MGPKGHRRRWLDVGCGSGALTETVIDWYDPLAAVAVDPSEGFVLTAQQRLGHKADGKIGNTLFSHWMMHR